MSDARKIGQRLVLGILFLVLGFPLLQTACDPATLARMQTNLKENLENRVEELPGEPAGDAGTRPTPGTTLGPCIERAC